ncbi:hypothetical protein [Prochlorococcus marinus]|uniref:Uncharacterized protein n=1 Tax=Prochlorococcus marinus (strain MIT 9211) TaxID=93059 RepID=A9BA88_PROM4|nr:hypothetical protein [Prochlorococcus marinus]ABX08750.1 Hypothetical protein P9211_08191 [Prochlorococcus marinus str. MIT 9211]
MIQSLVGAIIMSMATASLLIAIQVGEGALNNSKRLALSRHEKLIINRAGYSDTQKIKNLKLEIYTHIEQLLED